ncbi:PFU-domain-containing protein [Xylona heveae TC161]|uniref:PFU-domain-containing protein n=1 Tax=Xylona heveae (strain CBS 132557 / TC161) TaxID=1328760 RepID=A0A165H6Y2_XYLHT|nr:PFU-domain-containing protein [Xylona heveae TC161]KZF23070.1 PFU-domain-containing protein [Xylona heveae TC161]
MGDYKLSACLQGHEDDVRAVSFPNPELVLSASRDATVRLWKRLRHSPPEYDCTLSSHGTAFINALTYLQPSAEYPEGLVISGGRDTIIEVRQPGKSSEEDAEALLLGHAHNICALDSLSDGGLIVSGGWDAQARVWKVGKWECEAVLEGHQGSVWAVLAYDKNTIITGCADKLIRVFTETGKLVKTIRGSSDVVRALCRLPSRHPSGAHFASAGNDGLIRFWTLDGREVTQLQGHESFIYSLTCLPNGDLVSSGEDRTVRIWQGSQCIQTITHPAISVWTVAVCPQTGDIVTGASDRIVRLFTKSRERQADGHTIQAFEESVKASAIPQQQVGNVKKEQLPGPEFLQQKSGTKEGQVAMIRETDGSVTAHQWSSATQQWISVGTVVDSAGSSGRKQEFQGKDYDYVFDVDIEDGKPPLKLPYNLSQNPYEAATKFIQDNELPIAYLDQVANFITSNTQGGVIGHSPHQTAPGSDPWGTESRYRPGEISSAPASSSLPPESRPKILPQTSYLSIKSANLKVVQKKIEEINQQLIENGEKDISLNPKEINYLQSLIQLLEDGHGALHHQSHPLTNGLESVLKIITLWPPAQRIPGLDLLRLLAGATAAVAKYETPSGDTIVQILERSGVFEDKERSNNIMLAVRTFANLFESEEGRTVADGNFEKITSLVESSSTGTTNRNLTIAVTTLYINYAVLLTFPTHSIERAFTLLESLTAIISTTPDSEALYRALVGSGTLLSMGDEIRSAAVEIYNLPHAIEKAEHTTKEPRIKTIIQEIRDMLA